MLLSLAWSLSLQVSPQLFQKFILCAWMYTLHYITLTFRNFAFYLCAFQMQLDSGWRSKHTRAAALTQHGASFYLPLAKCGMKRVSGLLIIFQRQSVLIGFVIPFLYHDINRSQKPMSSALYQDRLHYSWRDYASHGKHLLHLPEGTWLIFMSTCNMTTNELYRVTNCY